MNWIRRWIQCAWLHKLNTSTAVQLGKRNAAKDVSEDVCLSPPQLAVRAVSAWWRFVFQEEPLFPPNSLRVTCHDEERPSLLLLTMLLSTCEIFIDCSKARTVNRALSIFNISVIWTDKKGLQTTWEHFLTKAVPLQHTLQDDSLAKLSKRTLHLVFVLVFCNGWWFFFLRCELKIYIPQTTLVFAQYLGFPCILWAKCMMSAQLVFRSAYFKLDFRHLSFNLASA